MAFRCARLRLGQASVSGMASWIGMIWAATLAIQHLLDDPLSQP
jgi:hypothetical protein